MDTEQLLPLYKKMLEIRNLELLIKTLNREGLMRGFSHQSVGQEAVAVGVCAALSDRDYITSNHRGHGHVVAKGIDLKLAVAELLGRATGSCGGKGGSMHIADPSLGILGANGIVGAGMPIAVGAALAVKKQGLKSVVACFFGDGASNEGSFHESLNLAAIWKLPVLFICENNLYGMSGPVKKMLLIKDIAIRAKSYGMPGIIGDGNDVEEVYKLTAKAVTRAKSGQGPSLLEFKTYRWFGHSVNDAGTYRSNEEVEEWKKLCPIHRLRKKLLTMGVTQKIIERIDMEAKAVVEEALDFAKSSPIPEPEAAFRDVYA
jgi:TPP-dependent pyruvate/acetoin dehydrogenase alpha subunit